MYYVNYGPDLSHITFEAKMFKRKKDALSFYRALPNKTKQVVCSEGGTSYMTVEGHRLCIHAIECMGQVFNGETRKELFGKIKDYLEEWDVKFLEFEGFKYFNQITEEEYSDAAATAITLNKQLKKENRADTTALDHLVSKLDKKYC